MEDFIKSRPLCLETATQLSRIRNYRGPKVQLLFMYIVTYRNVPTKLSPQVIPYVCMQAALIYNDSYYVSE